MATPQAQATLPLIWPAWREGKPDWQIVDLAAYIGEGFNLNSLIYAAIMYKARAITASPLRAYIGGPSHSEVLPPGHELSVLAARPNAWQSGLEFMQVNVVYLNLAGEAFILCGRRTATGPITSMVSLRPDRVFPIPADGGLKGYLYVPEGRAIQDGTPILATDMMHVKLPNPGDPLEGWGRGLSPMSALARSADVDNDITAFIKLFFERGAMPSSYLRFDKPMIESQLARARERYMEVYGGYRNWTDILVMDSGGEVKPMSMTFDEMGFDALDERNESRILGPFGVPPILLGTRTGLNRSTYSNAQEARKAFWEDTFLPEMRLFEVEFQYRLQTPDGGWVRFDTSGVPALQRDVPKLADTAYRLWTMGVPANRALQAVGLDVGEVPGGDTAYLPLAVVAVGSTPPPAQGVTPAAAGKEAVRAAEALLGGPFVE